MVRWVFRPYTQIPPAICTLARLRTSTRVSPGFLHSKYSSPSFGSSSINFYFQQKGTNPRGTRQPKQSSQCCRRLPWEPPSHSLNSLSFWIQIVTNHLILAYKWDSLVRVSRRVDLRDPHQLESNTHGYHVNWLEFLEMSTQSIRFLLQTNEENSEESTSNI